MKTSPNVIPFRKAAEPEPEAAAAPQVLGMLHRDDFELWVCRSETGAVSLKWWRWGGDQKKFFPLEDGQLTLDAEELEPLAGLLQSVRQMLDKKQGNR